MFKVDDYRKHAEECQLMLSRTRSEEERKMLEQMAETWESLAKGREEQLARQARMKKLDFPES